MDPAESDSFRRNLMNRLNRRRTARAGAIAALIATSLLANARADEPGFTAIFNGKDLTGWRLGSTDLAGKVSSEEGRFAVRDGILTISGSKDTSPKTTENSVEYRKIRVKRDVYVRRLHGH
jgi:hypothetical protein